MNETTSEVLQLLCSHLKLDRDKGIQAMERNLEFAHETELASMSDALLCKLRDPSSSWESKHGSLMAIKCFIPILVVRTTTYDQFLSSCESVSLSLLTDVEVRVRLSAGEVLGALCKFWGPQVYVDCKKPVLELIRSSLARQPPELDQMADTEMQQVETLITKFTSSSLRERRMSAEEIFHDTAGWKTLETSMKALQFMVDGCGKNFLPYINQELFDVIRTAFTHTNRFVRETSFYVCSSLVTCSAGDNLSQDNSVLYEFGHQFCKFLGLGMSDNWSQVRLASSVATRLFLLSFTNEQDRERFYPELLPKMCLNRYYLADGVRLYSQETWRLITDSRGSLLVQKYIQDVIAFYISQTQADNHAVREASCSCIAELANKIPHEVVQPFVTDLLATLLVCFQDDSWPVRDAACLACGNFINCFPQDCKGSLSFLYPLFFVNLEDNIASVRQGAAAALASVVKAYGEEAVNVVMTKLADGMKAVDNQPSESEKYGNLEKGPAVFGVVKRLRDNDMDLHTNQTMYSCGSLAPKMGRGRLGGCLDRSFRRPPQPWEQTDGCVYLLSELSLISLMSKEVESLLPVLAEVTRKRHYTHHYILLETICKQLPIIAKGIGKQHFKKYLESFFEPLFYALSCENALTSTAAGQSIAQLSQILGPGIMRGRIEMHNPNLLRQYEECVAFSSV